ncbi:MAG: hypothetical protein ACP6IS_05925 [Candidatus Asgardarchaeia archaeon]
MISLILLIISFVISFALVYLVAMFMRKIGHTGKDIHKKNHPEIPESVGLAIVISIAITATAALIMMPQIWNYFLAYILSVLIAGIIGLIDDFKILGPKIKPLILMLAGVPIIVLQAYTPYLRLPFLGNARLFFVYPFIILIAMSLGTNAVNMLDVYNGAMPSTALIVAIGLVLAAYMKQSNIGIYLSIILIGSLIAYLYFNRYPAKVFSGDTGSLAVGAALVSIAIMARLEFFIVIAMLPYILNSYEIIFSIGGLKERREMKERPTRVNPDETIEANKSKHAPITLTRLILAKGKLKEYEIVYCFILLTIFSTTLALITEYFIIRGVF